jgi:hypothetical protein
MERGVLHPKPVILAKYAALFEELQKPNGR